MELSEEINSIINHTENIDFDIKKYLEDNDEISTLFTYYKDENIESKIRIKLFNKETNNHFNMNRLYQNIVNPTRFAFRMLNRS